jgi:4-methylaminobutanoate oxidase (formaldehyde-forming)
MADLGFAVRMDKPGGFVGRDALVAARAQVPAKRLLAFVPDAPLAQDDRWLWGGEPIALGGEAVGELSSAGYSLRAARCVGLGYVRGAAAAQRHAGTPCTLEVWGEAVPATAWDDMAAALDAVAGKGDAR